MRERSRDAAAYSWNSRYSPGCLGVGRPSSTPPSPSPPPPAGFPPLLGQGSTCEPPLYLNPVTDQQRMGNMATVLQKLAAVGAVPEEGQVRRVGLEGRGSCKGAGAREGRVRGRVGRAEARRGTKREGQLQPMSLLITTRHLVLLPGVTCMYWNTSWVYCLPGYTVPAPPSHPSPLLQRLMTRVGFVPLRARDVVDANRDATLGLLMHVATRWQLPRLLGAPAELRAEVRQLLVQIRTCCAPPPPLAVVLSAWGCCLQALLRG